MHKLLIRYKPGIRSGNSVTVDGFELANITKSISMEITAGHIPEVNVKLSFLDVEIEADGSVFFDTSEIPEGLAKSLYQKLHEKFGQQP